LLSSSSTVRSSTRLRCTTSSR